MDGVIHEIKQKDGWC